MARDLKNGTSINNTLGAGGLQAHMALYFMGPFWVFRLLYCALSVGPIMPCVLFLLGP